MAYVLQSSSVSPYLYQTVTITHLVGQEVGDPYGAAETVRDATFINKCQPCARVSQGPLWGQAYSRHAERGEGTRMTEVGKQEKKKRNGGGTWS